MYDNNGFNKYGLNKDTKTMYDDNGFDKYGYNEYNGNNINGI